MNPIPPLRLTCALVDRLPPCDDERDLPRVRLPRPCPAMTRQLTFLPGFTDPARFGSLPLDR